jgi:hypothetical protein
MTLALGQHQSWCPCKLWNQPRVYFCLRTSLLIHLFYPMPTLFHVYQSITP